MLQFVVIGIVIGAVYSVFAVGLIATYQSSGILNFAYGSTAYFIASLYYFLHTQHGWSIWLSAAVSIVVVAPALGLCLWAAVFRLLQQRASTLVKIVSTIGLSVMLPALAVLLFGNPTILVAPGLVPSPVPTYQVFGVAITLDQVVAAAVVSAVLILGFIAVKTTQAGLVVRGLVDSSAMSSLTGTNPRLVSALVWMGTTCLAGLTGVLTAPLIGLTSDNYQLLMVAAFSAVLVARFVSFGRAIIASLALGIASSVPNYLLPPTSSITAGVVASVPFALMFLYLLYQAVRRQAPDELHTGGALDRAIAPVGEDGSRKDRDLAKSSDFRSSGWKARTRVLPTGLAFVLILLSLPLFLPSFWTGRVALGLCFGVVFIGWKIVTGEGGTIWLCQVALAGVGAMMTALLVTNDHWPLLPAIFAAGFCAVVVSFVVALLSTRLGDLYVALVTLAIGILFDRLVFTASVFQGPGATGIPLTAPSFLTSHTSFFYVMLGLVCVVVLLAAHLRQSTAGLSLTAVRGSERTSRAMGLSVVKIKILAACVAGFMAALGGAFIAISSGYGVPSTYDSLAGLVWLAALVTFGIRSSWVAVLAGIFYAVMPTLFSTYLPASLASVPALLFGLGAVVLCLFPDGTVVMHVQLARRLMAAGSREHPMSHGLEALKVPNLDGRGTP